jgi:CRP-like cAMP-binding protein
MSARDDAKLDKWRLFADLTQEDAAYVLSVAAERFLVAGEELFRENDPGDSLWIVQSGRVDVFKAIRGDVERALISLSAGDVIGEISFLDGARRSATARTAQASELLVLSRSDFGRVIKERPAVAATFYRNLSSILAARLRTTNDLYREAVAFGLEATGAGALNLKSLAEEIRRVTVHLSGGVSIAGQILQMDSNPAGYTLVLRDEAGRLTIVPYHAIQRLELT